MASTPLYKGLKSNGTTFYAFPGAAEDISASYQNANYKMYFSKYALLNFPSQNLSVGTQSKPIYFDFESSFRKSVNATPPADFSSQIVESLRNYVANQEIVIRESRLNNTKYYYDTNALETTSEKLFFKWCKKLNVIDFVRWDNNINEVFLSNKKVVKNESEELIEFSNRFEWLENLILNKKYIN